MPAKAPECKGFGLKRQGATAQGQERIFTV